MNVFVCAYFPPKLSIFLTQLCLMTHTHPHIHHNVYGARADANTVASSAATVLVFASFKSLAARVFLGYICFVIVVGLPFGVPLGGVRLNFRN